MARLIQGYAVPAFENVPLWHERDISHSSVERVILPDATTALDYILNETTKLIDKLLVYPEKMLADLNMTGGLIYSPRVLLALVREGRVPRHGVPLGAAQRHEALAPGRGFL